MAKIKPAPIIDYLTTEEYAEGRHAYKELGPGADCPYPITCTDGRRYRWFMGWFDQKFEGLKCVQPKVVEKIQDTE